MLVQNSKKAEGLDHPIHHWEFLLHLTQTPVSETRREPQYFSMPHHLQTKAGSVEYAFRGPIPHPTIGTPWRHHCEFSWGTGLLQHDTHC